MAGEGMNQAIPERRWRINRLVDLSDGEDVVVTRRHSTTNAGGERPDVRRLVGGCAAAVRRLHAATTPEPAHPVIGLSGDQINKRFAAACRG